MVTFDDLLRCIDWTRSRLHDDEDIPDIASPEFDLFAHDLIDWSDVAENIGATTLLEWSLNALTLNNGDTATRLIILALHWQLVYGWDKPPKDEEGRPAFKTNLDELLNLVVPSDCHDWRTIRWEIVNAFYAQNPSRMEALFLRALDINLERADRIYAFRAICRYLTLFGQEIAEWLVSVADQLTDRPALSIGELQLQDSMLKQADLVEVSGLSLSSKLVQHRLWEPDRIESNWSGEQVLFRWAVSASRGRNDGRAFSSHATLVDVIEDLQKALIGRSDLHVVYRCVLADCLYKVERYREAARQYERVLQDPAMVESERRIATYESPADSYVAAGEEQEATRALERSAKEFPSYKPHATLRIAEIIGRRSPEDAYRFLKEADFDTLGKERWGLSLVLSLGGALDIANEHEQERLAAVLASRPETFQPIAGMARDWWPWFSKLTDGAKDAWIAAMYQRYFTSQDQSQKSGVSRFASIGSALAVEIELRDRVFRPFRERMRKESASVPNREHNSTTSTGDPLAEFVAGNDKLSLGQMGKAIRNCFSSGNHIERKLCDWLRARFRGLTNPEIVRRIRSISEVRGEAAHSSFDTSRGEHLLHDCCEVLKAVHSGV